MRPGRAALAALPLLFLGAFFLWPVLSIIGTGLWHDGALDLDGFRRVASDGDLWGVLWFSTWQAALSTGLTLLVGLPAAHVFARYDFRGKAVLRALATVPFVLPTIVVATAFLALAGPAGILPVNLDGTIWAILGAHVFFNHAVVLRTVGSLWAHLDPRHEEVARSLGASPLQTFRHVTLPLLRPAIAAASSIVFLFTFTSFGVVLVLGGRGLTTLEVEIYRQTAILFDLPVAAALATIQLVGVTAILWWYARVQERATVQQRLRPVGETARRIRSTSERWYVTGVLASMAVVLGAPIAVLVERSLRTAGGYGIRGYTALGDAGRTGIQIVDPVEATRNSLQTAAVATAVALVVGLAAAAVLAKRSRWSRWFDALIMLPLGTSAATVGFGFLVALDAPVDLRASAILVPIAHALVAIPFVVRTVGPVLRSVRTDLREAAMVLGASPWRARWEVDVPIVSRATLVAAGFAAAVSLGEFGATVFIARPDTTTLPVAIFRFLGRPGALNFSRAMAASVLLMAVTAAIVLAVERFRPARLGEF
ncbi:MAG: iron ABC transporter permease [Acidimicrobiia bacterium]|nr:iron ABC transporter permease [Acidimicrobiia bacterium]